MLLPTQILWGAPLEGALAKGAPAPPTVTINRKLPRLAPGPGPLSASPSAAEIGQQRLFEEPLVPVGGEPSGEENRALAGALRGHSLGDSGRTSIRAFVAANPRSPWRASLLTNLGLRQRRAGEFTAALESWEEAWMLARGETDPAARAVADRALGELLDLHLTFGHVEALEAKLEEIEGRDVQGSAAQKVSRAREAVWILRYHHEDAVPSARTALDRLLAAVRPGQPVPEEVAAIHGAPQGMTLDELQGTAVRVGLRLSMAFRAAGAAVPLPAIVHLKVGHYSTILKEQGGYFLLDDPVLGGALWMSREVLDRESSGYFLVPQGKLGAGWRAVGPDEASGIHGKCVPTLYNTQQIGPCAPQSGGNANCGASGPPMAVHSVHTLAASLHVTDTPVGYAPPRGPQVRFQVNYNQREAAQPQTFSYSNLGRNWTLDWLSYVTDDPDAPQPSGGTVYLRGAGGETFSPINGVGTSTPHLYSRAVMARTSLSPIRYERRLPDGSLEVFDLSDGANPRRVFLTKVVDPQGQALTFTYDGLFRLVAATDAIGQVTTVSYELPADPLKVTKVTDPFGRFATFEYNAGGQLARITDVGGIQSSFTYGPGDTITSETTPYGTHHFEVGEGSGNRWVNITDPLGATERVEYDYVVDDQPPETPPAGMVSDTVLLAAMNSYYWDKRAMALHAGQHAFAEVTHWMREWTLHLVSGVPHSTKRPLENRVWYNYAGSDSSGGRDVANETRPSIVGRILDDGSAQLSRFEYNGLDNVTRATDPLGRETVYEYAPNGIDLLRVKQKNPAGAGGYDLLASSTYNGQYEPLTATDASGQTTTLTYNEAGQLQTATNAKNETWTLVYDTSGYLQTLSGPIAGATLSLTYDGYGRPRTLINFEGYTVTVDYDVFDRPTRASFPNGTYEQVIYDRLHPSQFRDLLGRWSQLFVDALGRPTSFRDPLGRTITLQWCGCGALEKLLDGNGHATRWERDDQGRVIREIRADDTVRSRTFEATTSRVKTVTDARGQVRTYSYFRDDQLQSVIYSNAAIPTPAVSFTFDPVYGRVATRVDGTGTTTYGYNPVSSPPALGAARLATIDGPLTNDLVGYTYDELGRPLSRSIAGQATSVLYDVLGRVTNVTNVLGAFTYGYDGNTSRVASVAGPGGFLRSYEYFDQAGDHQLRRITNQSGSNVISRFTYGYNAQNQITTWTQQQGADPAKRYELSYDSADQLTAAILKDDASGAILKRYGYAYDQSYNRTSEQIDDVVTSGSHNAVDERTSQQAGGALRVAGSTNEPATVTVQGQPATTTPANGFGGTAAATAGVNTVAVTAIDSSGNVRTNTYDVTVTGGSGGTLTYDANGNLTSDGTRTYEWDGANRLTAINQGAYRTELTYDGFGRRTRIVEKENDSVTSDKRFLWVGTGLVEQRDSAGVTTSKRFFGQGVQEGGTNLLYTQDHLGSVHELVDPAGTVRAQYSYEPFGRRSKTSGDLEADRGFTGHFEHQQSGLKQALYREYDSSLGRWLSRDPIGLRDGNNLYGYVQNDPINLVDRLGLSYETFQDGAAGALPSILGGLALGIGVALLAPAAVPALAIAGIALGVLSIVHLAWTAFGSSCGTIDKVDQEAGGLFVGSLAGLGAGIGGRGAGGIKKSPVPDLEPTNLAELTSDLDLPTDITGYTKHGINQAISRNGVGVKPDAILDAMNHPLDIQAKWDPKLGQWAYKYTGQNGTVVLNQSGKVITGWANNSGAARCPVR